MCRLSNGSVARGLGTLDAADPDMYHVLSAAGTTGSQRLMDWFMGRNGVTVNAFDGILLYGAAFAGKLAAVRWLVTERGANVHGNNDGRCASPLAAITEQRPCGLPLTAAHMPRRWLRPRLWPLRQPDRKPMPKPSRPLCWPSWPAPDPLGRITLCRRLFTLPSNPNFLTMTTWPGKMPMPQSWHTRGPRRCQNRRRRTPITCGH